LVVKALKQQCGVDASCLGEAGIQEKWRDVDASCLGEAGTQEKWHDVSASCFGELGEEVRQ
jgi:hypothetical protein